jgi:hypothetical protein
MQNRFVVAGIVCLIVGGPACAQAVQDELRQDVQPQPTSSQSPGQSRNDSSVGGVADMKTQYGVPHTQTQNCSFPPNCDIFFGN